jgi:hypothetical protein
LLAERSNGNGSGNGGAISLAHRVRTVPIQCSVDVAVPLPVAYEEWMKPSGQVDPQRFLAAPVHIPHRGVLLGVGPEREQFQPFGSRGERAEGAGSDADRIP